MKKMIFHIPMKIDLNVHSGSQIRPQKMIQAFKNITTTLKHINEGY